ncbi:hypothetical protein WJX81_001665 [Elliptochloris bilobata]|uniref:Uncharacterized protein n=1 Tax=Elliptochloris bilobata TaxID=381761 RepID=A0AAW1R1W1_9CHLO
MNSNRCGSEPAVAQAGARLVICYHYPCHDRAFAALAAHLHFKSTGGGPRFVPNRVYTPCMVGDLQLQGDETVYLLDYAGPSGFAAAVARAVPSGRVFLLDHHKSTAEQLHGVPVPINLHITLDQSRSGVVIALEHFQPQESHHEHAPAS